MINKWVSTIIAGVVILSFSTYLYFSIPYQIDKTVWFIGVCIGLFITVLGILTSIPHKKIENDKHE